MTTDKRSDQSTDSTPTEEKLHTASRTVESEQSGAGPLSRRTLLKGAASAAIGATGVSAISGTAAAGDFGCDYTFARAPPWFGFVDAGTGDIHNLPWESDDLVIFIHGFKTDRQGGLDYGYEVWRKLRAMGYRGDAFSFIWPSTDSNRKWSQAQYNANQSGHYLADFLVNNGWLSVTGPSRVHFVCHSLGARVALECIRRLHLTYDQLLALSTVHFLGGAVYDRYVGGYYRENIEYVCDEVHNWHSTNDDVLGTVFRAAEGGRWAVGWRGIASGPVPENYTDHDQAYEIHQHCEYMHYDAGVVNNLYYTL
jgi:hypothetical protein